MCLRPPRRGASVASLTSEVGILSRYAPPPLLVDDAVRVADLRCGSALVHRNQPLGG